ncbi:MAG: SRPBCC family protein, partial [Solirubrobacteraceae bacterium]
MGGLSGSADAEISAQIDEVWAVVQDVLAAPQWQSGLETVTALEHDADGRPTLVDSESDIKVRRVRSRVRIRYERPTRLTWTQERGDLKAVKAVWEFEDLGDGRTHVRYQLDADLGGLLGRLIRGPVQSATKAIFVDGRPGEL